MSSISTLGCGAASPAAFGEVRVGEDVVGGGGSDEEVGWNAHVKVFDEDHFYQRTGTEMTSERFKGYRSIVSTFTEG